MRFESGSLKPAVLVLASDGVWDVMETAAALTQAREDLVLDDGAACLEGQSAARNMVERATGKLRSADDTTAVIVRLTVGTEGYQYFN